MPYRSTQKKLTEWLIGNTTGHAKLRAGLSSTWKVGDKTGSGAHGASNDVAIIWPENNLPFLITVYYTGSTISPDQQSQVIAEVGRIIGRTFYKN